MRRATRRSCDARALPSLYGRAPTRATLLVLLALSLACGSETPAGGPCAQSADTDRDTISDCDEGRAVERSSDQDEYPDWRDLDSDGDLIPDSVEAGDGDLSTPPVDSDQDMTPDYVDPDSDGDGIPDAVETGGDADGDGIPNFLELDADGDGILDVADGTADPEGDGLANFLDPDSDGDGIPDELESGAETPPRDTDRDGVPDFLDLDSDGDFVPDRDEDSNGNGTVDPCVIGGPCDSSPTSADTDGDGTPDLIERVAGSNPSDPSSNIPANDFFFVLPYNGPSQAGTFDFSTDLRRADVFFSVDTTGSFQEEIDQIQSTLEQTISKVQTQIPDVGFGVGRFEDFPLEPYGLSGDVPFELIQPITEGNLPAVRSGVATLSPAAGGLDRPESGIEALYQWATGAGIPDFGYAPFYRGGIGGVGFRPYALPIVVQITDARSHEPTDYVEFSASAHSRDDAILALQAIGARVIGVDSLENASNADDPRAELEAIAIATDAVIPPNAAGQCLTGVGNSPVPPVSRVCPLVFDVLPNGSGLGDLIVDAIVRLASLGTLDISTALEGFATDLVGEPLPSGLTSARFLQSVTPVPPPPPGATIAGDEFKDVRTGSRVTFRVTARNDFLRPADHVRLFDANIQVLGDRVTLLDVRRVYIVVPSEEGTCPSSVEICGDRFDNDCDGVPDEAACCTPAGTEACENGIDDDCDGEVDRADSECCISSGRELCTNGLDDDCNGLTDALDPTCGF